MLKHIYAITRKEFIHLIRDPRSLVISIFLPVFLLFIYGYSVSFDIKNIPVAIRDNSKSYQSRQLIDKFLHSGYFLKAASLTSENQFKDAMDSGRAKVIINIPSDFARNIHMRRRAVIQVILDGSDPTAAASALSYINGIAQQFFSGLLVLQSVHNPSGSAPPVNLITRIWYNENLRSLNFYIPGLISSILLMLAASLTSLTIVSEKEMGTMEALIASPIRKNELMIGKILPYVMLAFWDVVLVTAVGHFWFMVPIKGSIILLFFCATIFLTGALALGLFFSVISQSSQEAMQLALLATMLPSMMLSGMIFPIENMPPFIQLFTFLVPARYFISISRGIFLKGIGVAYLWPEMAMLTVFTLILMWLCVRAFKKRID
jgi:ABC-2 type transport system permease protein